MSDKKYDFSAFDNHPSSKYDFNAFDNHDSSEAIGIPESIARGAATGATFGFAPAISGAAQAGAATLTGGVGSLQELMDKYSQARDKSKKEFDAAQEANPKSYLGGTLLGGLAPAILTGGVSEEASAAQALSGLTKGILGADTVAGVLTGAGQGALTGLGGSVSGGEGLTDTTKSVVGGAVGGGLIGGVASKLGSAIANKLGPDALETMAQNRALKATGIGKGPLKNIMKNDIRSENFAAASGVEAPESQVANIGKSLLDKNPYQETPVVTMGSTTQDILDRAQNLEQKSGKDIGDVLKQFDATFSENNPTIIDKFVNPSDIAKEIEDQLLKPIQVNGEIPRVSVPAARAIQDIIDTVKDFGNTPITFEKANELKQLIKNLANYENEGSASNQALRRAGGIINAKVEEAADKVASEINMPELADRYKQAKELYGVAKTTVDASLGKVAGNAVNRDLGLTDYMAAGMGAMHGGPATILATAGNKLSKTYGNTTLASGARGMSNVLSKINSTLVGAKKETLGELGRYFIGKGGELEKSLGNILVKGSERDDIGRNALIYTLMQNAGYRKLLRNQMGIKEPTK